MAWPKGVPRPPGAGRKKGTPNLKTSAVFIEEFLRDYPDANALKEAWRQYLSFKDSDSESEGQKERMHRDDMAERWFKHVIARLHPAPKPVEITGAGGDKLSVQIVRFVKEDVVADDKAPE